VQTDHALRHAAQERSGCALLAGINAELPWSPDHDQDHPGNCPDQPRHACHGGQRAAAAAIEAGTLAIDSLMLVSFFEPKADGAYLAPPPGSAPSTPSRTSCRCRSGMAAGRGLTSPAARPMLAADPD